MTGNDLIDTEHRALIDAINDLMEACEQGHGRQQMIGTAEFLSDYVVQHFSDEEKLQKQHRYPNFDAHHAFHGKYIQQVKDMVEDMRRNGATIQNLSALNQAAGILINHIRSEDKRLAAFLREQSGQ